MLPRWDKLQDLRAQIAGKTEPQQPAQPKPDITQAVADAADRITAARVVTQMVREGKRVPLEIKGLKANMLQLRHIVSGLNTDAAAAIEKGTALKGHIGDLKKELGDHVSDIEFAAGILGNSGVQSEGSEKPKDQSGEKQVITSADVGSLDQHG